MVGMEAALEKTDSVITSCAGVPAAARCCAPLCCAAGACAACLLDCSSGTVPSLDDP